MADEYIKRETILRKMQNVATEAWKMKIVARVETSWNEAQDLVKSIPSADVRPVVHGTWLTKEYMYGDPDVGISDMWIDRRAEQSDYYAYCSNCGKDAGYNNSGDIILSDYCPKCGAKMDLE